MAQPRIFTFSKGGGSKGDKTMKELVSAILLLLLCCCCTKLTVLPATNTAQHMQLLQLGSPYYQPSNTLAEQHDLLQAYCGHFLLLTDPLALLSLLFSCAAAVLCACSWVARVPTCVRWPSVA